MASCKRQPGIFMGRMRNADEESANVVGVSVEISARHLTDINERRSLIYYTNLIEVTMKYFGTPRTGPGCKDGIETDKRKIRSKDMKWIQLVQRLVKTDHEVQFL